MKLPTILYKKGGPHHAPAGLGNYSYLGVNTAGEAEDALANGWHDTLLGAFGKSVDKPVIEKKPEPIPADDAPPNRAELEEMATALGIPFKKTTTDKALFLAIEKATKGS